MSTKSNRIPRPDPKEYPEVHIQDRHGNEINEGDIVLLADGRKAKVTGFNADYEYDHNWKPTGRIRSASASLKGFGSTISTEFHNPDKFTMDGTFTWARPGNELAKLDHPGAHYEYEIERMEFEIRRISSWVEALTFRKQRVERLREEMLKAHRDFLREQEVD